MAQLGPHRRPLPPRIRAPAGLRTRQARRPSPPLATRRYCRRRRRRRHTTRAQNALRCLALAPRILILCRRRQRHRMGIQLRPQLRPQQSRPCNSHNPGEETSTYLLLVASVVAAVYLIILQARSLRLPHNIEHPKQDLLFSFFNDGPFSLCALFSFLFVYVHTIRWYVGQILYEFHPKSFRFHFYSNGLLFKGCFCITHTKSVASPPL
jgi:hypothetical protein